MANGQQMEKIQGMSKNFFQIAIKDQHHMDACIYYMRTLRIDSQRESQS